MNEDWSYLERYIDRYDFVALGGLVPYMGSVRKIMPWLIKCFRMAEGTGTVFHGLGVTNWTILKSLPFYSVDSTSWASGYRYGRLPVFSPQRKEFIQVQLGTRDAFEHARLIRDYGYEPEDFADRTRNTREHNGTIAALSYMEAEKWLRARHGAVCHPQKPDIGETPTKGWGKALNGVAQDGPKIFLVDANLNTFKLITTRLQAEYV